MGYGRDGGRIMPIAFEQVNYIYAPKTPFEYEALKRIDLAIELNKITAIIGPTGSGKSTLVQHLNALLLPSAGTVYVLDREIVANQKNKDLKSLRKKVGLVFQFPEYQMNWQSWAPCSQFQLVG